ncbi:MAG TPA: alpha/beta fold hydrolase [Acidimicrobiales bacterium]|nr:alpha/beta fold hydrolase [Acidimicrobiales bacterium]
MRLRRDPEPPIPPLLPDGRVVNVPGRGEMFVREAPAPAPDAPTVVLLHGWTASADLNWFAAYSDVARLARLVAPDHRGHGRGLRSEERFSLEAAADDVAALLRHLDAAPAVLVGYSMGGPIAMLAWHRHPDVVAGLVLQATALEWRASWYERFVWRFMALVELSLRLGTPDGIIERLLRDAIERCPEIAPLRGWLKGELRRGDPADLAQAGRALGLYDARPFAGSVDVPTVVVVTTKDRLVRPKKQRALAAAVPGARMLTLAADHDAPLLKMQEFRAVTTEALRLLSRTGAASPRSG